MICLGPLCASVRSVIFSMHAAHETHNSFRVLVLHWHAPAQKKKHTVVLVATASIPYPLHPSFQAGLSLHARLVESGSSPKLDNGGGTREPSTHSPLPFSLGLGHCPPLGYLSHWRQLAPLITCVILISTGSTITTSSKHQSMYN